MICTINVKNVGDYNYCVITMINGVKLNLTMESFEKIMDATIENEKIKINPTEARKDKFHCFWRFP